mgnify:CR=1 FL=1
MKRMVPVCMSSIMKRKGRSTIMRKGFGGFISLALLF